MCDLLKNILTLLLVILKLCNSTSGQNFTLKSLSVVCSIYNYTKVPVPPEQCTAMAAYTSIQDQVDEANKMRGKLPLLIIMDTLEYFKDYDFFKKDPVESLKDFKQVNFDCMAFDYAYELTYKKVGTTSADIGIFLDKAKKEFPDKGFGLALSQYLEKMEERLDLALLKDHVDFFLLNTTDFRYCVHRHKQEKMRVLATKDDVFDSLDELKEIQQPINKMIFSIDLKIESEKTHDSSYAELDFSYARLRITECTAGIYVRGIDFDDYIGTCGCLTSTDSTPTFRGLKTIAGASQEEKNNVSYYDCAKGAYPVIK